MKKNKKEDVKDIVVLLCTIILPPLGVALKTGLSSHLLLNLFLTIFGFYILGLLHGLYVVLKK